MLDPDDPELMLWPGVLRLMDDPSATAAAAPSALEEDKVKLMSSIAPENGGYTADNLFATSDPA